MIRVVLDHNVGVSSFFQPAGAPSRLVDAWKADLFELCLSGPLFDEIESVLNRPVIQRMTRATREEMGEFLDLLAETSFFVPEPLAVRPVLAADSDDNIVLATALAAQADAIVSGDQHLLDLEMYEGIPIVNSRMFLDMLGEIKQVEIIDSFGRRSSATPESAANSDRLPHPTKIVTPKSIYQDTQRMKH